MLRANRGGKCKASFFSGFLRGGGFLLEDRVYAERNHPVEYLPAADRTLVCLRQTGLTLAPDARALSHMAFGNHAPANADRGGYPLLSSFSQPVSGHPGACSGRGCAVGEALGGPWLLQSGAVFEKGCGSDNGTLRWRTSPAGGGAEKLPGIGDYTAGAISSIAFGEPEPAVDGNVLRVITRVLACGEDIRLAGTRSRITELLRRCYPAGEDAALLTEGIMELGETVCIPNGEARCRECPLQAHCLAHKNGIEAQFPVKSPMKKRRVEEKNCAAVPPGGKVRDPPAPG